MVKAEYSKMITWQRGPRRGRASSLGKKRFSAIHFIRVHSDLAPHAGALMERQFAPPTPAALTATVESASRRNEQFEPLPPPTGESPFRMRLEQLVGDEAAARIREHGSLTFHVAADTGGVKDPKPQQVVAMKMEEDLKATAGTPDAPAFFYNVGDVVYFKGEGENYFDQFYYPYEHYDLPIVAVPGNHDGSPRAGTTSLEAFVRNFCAPRPDVTPDAGDTTRTAMTQPNVYWTLETPFANIIGLYTNVPEGGQVGQDQEEWFVGELAAAPADRAVLVMLHHPPYSVDDFHSGSARMLALIERASERAGRFPDAVFSGHVHNYQRFTRTHGDAQVPFLVCGNGGYWHLHYVGKMPDGTPLQLPYDLGNGVVLNSYVDTRHGFLKVTVSPDRITGRFFSAPRPQDSFRDPAGLADEWSLDLQTHSIT